jgi:3-hydroxyisobutyrate dehydrogenase-like beta-hydroxyacid dehydrogenase
MNYAVNIDYDESYGIDHVKVMEGMGAFGRRVDHPDEIRDALEWAAATAEEQRRPHGQRMLDGNYDPGFKLRLHRKDLAIALQLGREERVPLFATAQAAELMDSLLAQGACDRDHSALATLYEQLAGVSEAVQAR